MVQVVEEVSEHRHPLWHVLLENGKLVEMAPDHGDIIIVQEIVPEVHPHRTDTDALADDSNYMLLQEEALPISVVAVGANTVRFGSGFCSSLFSEFHVFFAIPGPSGDNSLQ